MIFKDRRDAGKQLAPQLDKYKDCQDVIVLGLARGGLVVADEVARRVHAPLNVLVVRKVGAPGNLELALGAISERGEGIFNEELLHMLEVSSEYLEGEIERQRTVLKERLQLYRGKISAPDLNGKIAIIVDDGIATGASMQVAIQSVRAAKPAKIVMAIPVAAPDSLRKISPLVDEVICLSSPAFFGAVGAFYQVFDQTSDDEVVHILSSYSS